MVALICASSDESNEEAQSRIDKYLKPSEKLVLQKAPIKHEKQHKEEKSFMSKLASWFFPFGGSDDTQDAVPAEAQSRAHYAPPAHQEKQCNPCNSVPWVPIASNRGPHTLSDFRPPKHLPHSGLSSHGSGFDLKAPEPQINYGPPSGDYGPPPAPSGSYGLPSVPAASYGAPAAPSGSYGASQIPSGNYGTPSAPSGSYGPPTSFTLPIPVGNYGPPPPPAAPLTNYGPPQISVNYSPPPSLDHGVSSLPLDEYGPPPAAAPSNHYGAPSFLYGPPQPHDQFLAASQHSPQKEQQSSKHKSPHFKPGGLLKSGSQTLSKPYKFIPVKYTQFPKLELGPKPPNHGPPVTFRPLTVQDNVKNQFANSNFELQKIPPLETYQNLPSDNFAAPIDHHPATYVVPPPLHFTAAPPQFTYNHRPLHSGFSKNVRGPFIPLPNLSLKPVLPIRNYHNFNTGFPRPNDNLPQQGAHIPVHASGNHHEVEVQPSIPIAGYLASIEHPINVIQSPIVEVTVKEEEQEHTEETVPAVGSSTPSKETEKAIANAGVIHTTPNFNEHPIIVAEHDDAHAAETSHNQTIHEDSDHTNKRGNDNNLGIFSFEKEHNREHFNVLKENQGLIQQILSGQSFSSTTTEVPASLVQENQTRFTRPPLDYNSWTPSFASNSGQPSVKMTPPSEATSPWLNYITKYDHVSSTTKKPKHIQVIVPYITNQKPMPFKSEQGSPQQVDISTVKPVFHDGLPTYFTPPSKLPVWPNYSDSYLQQESQKVVTAQKPLNHASNIRELLRGEIDSKQQTTQSLPFDIITLQKTIDDWTQQEFSNKLNVPHEPKATTISKLVPSKKIPNDFFTTSAYSTTTQESTAAESNGHYGDHSVAGSDYSETKVKKDVADFESNFIVVDGSSDKPSTELIATTSSEVEGFGSTGKEALYIVTAKPWEQERENASAEPRANITHKTATFAIRLESENDTLNSNKTEKVIYSEWPHLSEFCETG